MNLYADRLLKWLCDRLETVELPAEFQDAFDAKGQAEIVAEQLDTNRKVKDCLTRAIGFDFDDVEPLL